MDAVTTFALKGFFCIKRLRLNKHIHSLRGQSAVQLSSIVS